MDAPKAEAANVAQRAGIECAKQSRDRAYLGELRAIPVSSLQTDWRAYRRFGAPRGPSSKVAPIH